MNMPNGSGGSTATRRYAEDAVKCSWCEQIVDVDAAKQYAVAQGWAKDGWLCLNCNDNDEARSDYEAEADDDE